MGEREQALADAADAIRKHANQWAPKGGNRSQERLRRHLLIAERVVLGLDGIDKAEIGQLLDDAITDELRLRS